MESFMQKNQSVLGLVGVFLTFFLIVSTVKVLREIKFVGSGTAPTNTITVSGKGEIEKSPDTAKITFSVRSEKKVLKDAQDEVTTKIDAIKKALVADGVAEEYIKTDSYTSYPQYTYPEVACYGVGCPRPGTPTLRGYEVSHMITVSIKNLEIVEKVLATLGANNVSDMQGPSFGFEDDKVVAREARDKAIADAQAEAEKLADALGVKLVRIVSFSDSSGGGYPMPTYSRQEGAVAMDQKSVTLPVGVQNVQAQVTIVYEIR
jgi:uncharacterized protein YggE